MSERQRAWRHNFMGQLIKMKDWGKVTSWMNIGKKEKRVDNALTRSDEQAWLGMLILDDFKWGRFIFAIRGAHWELRMHFIFLVTSSSGIAGKDFLGGVGCQPLGLQNLRWVARSDIQYKLERVCGAYMYKCSLKCLNLWWDFHTFPLPRLYWNYVWNQRSFPLFNTL